MQKQNIQLQLNDLFQLKEQIEEKLEEKVLFKNFHLEIEPIVSEFIQILDNLDKESKNMINNHIINTTFDIQQYESHFSEEEKENVLEQFDYENTYECVLRYLQKNLESTKDFLKIFKYKKFEQTNIQTIKNNPINSFIGQQNNQKHNTNFNNNINSLNKSLYSTMSCQSQAISQHNTNNNNNNTNNNTNNNLNNNINNINNLNNNINNHFSYNKHNNSNNISSLSQNFNQNLSISSNNNNYSNINLSEIELVNIQNEILNQLREGAEDNIISSFHLFNFAVFLEFQRIYLSLQEALQLFEEYYDEWKNLLQHHYYVLFSDQQFLDHCNNTFNKAVRQGINFDEIKTQLTQLQNQINQREQSVNHEFRQKLKQFQEKLNDFLLKMKWDFEFKQTQNIFYDMNVEVQNLHEKFQFKSKLYGITNQDTIIKHIQPYLPELKKSENLKILQKIFKDIETVKRGTAKFEGFKFFGQEQVIGHINTWLNQNESFLEILKKLLQQQQQ